MKLLRAGVIFAVVALVAAQPAQAVGSKKKAAPGIAGKATPPEEALKAYIERVRAQQAAEVRTPGSIWSSEGRLVRWEPTPRRFGCTT
jgi:hypothetical protein